MRAGQAARRQCGSSGTRGRHSMTCSRAGVQGAAAGTPEGAHAGVHRRGDSEEQRTRALHERVLEGRACPLHPRTPAHSNSASEPRCWAQACTRVWANSLLAER